MLLQSFASNKEIRRCIKQPWPTLLSLFWKALIPRWSRTSSVHVKPRWCTSPRRSRSSRNHLYLRIHRWMIQKKRTTLWTTAPIMSSHLRMIRFVLWNTCLVLVRQQLSVSHRRTIMIHSRWRWSPQRTLSMPLRHRYEQVSYRSQEQTANHRHRAYLQCRRLKAWIQPFRLRSWPTIRQWMTNTHRLSNRDLPWRWTRMRQWKMIRIPMKKRTSHSNWTIFRMIRKTNQPFPNQWYQHHNPPWFCVHLPVLMLPIGLWSSLDWVGVSHNRWKWIHHWQKQVSSILDVHPSHSPRSLSF